MPSTEPKTFLWRITIWTWACFRCFCEASINKQMLSQAPRHKYHRVRMLFILTNLFQSRAKWRRRKLWQITWEICFSGVSRIVPLLSNITPPPPPPPQPQATIVNDCTSSNANLNYVHNSMVVQMHCYCVLQQQQHFTMIWIGRTWLCTPWSTPPSFTKVQLSFD